MLAPAVQALSLLFLLALGFVLGFAAPSTHDPDIWWHLKTGEWILANGMVPWSDPFGHNTGGVRWIAYSWLAEVFFYRVDRMDPLLGLRFVQGVVAVSTVAVLYIHARAASQRSRLTLLLCALFLVPTFPWVARPQIFSFLFTALTMLLLWWGEHRDRRAWWALPPLMLLWANLHIYFLMGLGLVWLLLAWPWLFWFLHGRVPGTRPSFSGVLVALLATAAPLLNPYGYTLYDEAFRLAIHGAAEWPATVIKELASPNFHDWPRKIFFIWFALGVVALIGPAKKPPILVVLLFLLLLHRSLQHVRDAAYFVIVMLPVFAERLASIESPILHRYLSGDHSFWRTMPTPRAMLNWFLAAGALVAFAAYPTKLWSEKAEEAKRREDKNPASAVAYLLEQRPQGPIYNSLNWGSYLIYKLSPVYQVYIDGRTQLYTKSFWDAHDKVWQGKPGWEQSLDSTGARIVLWHRDGVLASLLRLSPQWTLVHEDAVAVVYVKRQ